jgi:hypothetical protein
MRSRNRNPKSLLQKHKYSNRTPELRVIWGIDRHRTPCIAMQIKEKGKGRQIMLKGVAG